jgi:hypothetical protein
LASTKDTSLLKPAEPDDCLQEVLMPFVQLAEPLVEKLNRLHADLQQELSALLQYFGEKDGSIETLFSTILSFAHGLQRAAAEMTRHAAETTPKSIKPTEGVSDQTINAMSSKLDKHEAMLSAVTIKGHLAVSGPSAFGTLAQGRRTVRGTLSRGELDDAIRSIHGGVRRRERETLGRGGGVRLSKMFLDGAHVGAVGSGSIRIRDDGMPGKSG